MAGRGQLRLLGGAVVAAAAGAQTDAGASRPLQEAQLAIGRRSCDCEDAGAGPDPHRT